MAPTRAVEPDLLPGADPSRPLTVSEVAELIDQAVREEVGEVWVEGEIRDFRFSAAGHAYCTLTDGQAGLNLTIFSRVPKPDGLEDGARVLVLGSPQYYGPYARLSVIVEEVHLSGEGALWARIEKIRQKLASEGLFDEERKRPLPLLPAAVGVVCGFDAAVEHDIRDATEKRFPGYPLVFEKVTVQGERAVPEIVRAMRRLASHPLIEVIILARGGGSLADMMPFYDEGLCRAIAECPVPVVSAIGHEKDNPLTDLVADHRSSTPSRAAMEVIPDERQLRDRLAQAADAIHHSVARRIQLLDSRLALLDPSRTFRDHYLADRLIRLRELRALLAEASPTAALERALARLAEARLGELLGLRLASASASLESLGAALAALGPEATLARGYAVVWDSQGRIVRHPEQAPEGEMLAVRVAGGRLDAVSRGPSRGSDSGTQMAGDRLGWPRAGSPMSPRSERRTQDELDEARK